jgi:hypothetical protein
MSFSLFWEFSYLIKCGLTGRGDWVDRKGIAVPGFNEPDEKARRVFFDMDSPVFPIRIHPRLYRVPQVTPNDRFVQSGIPDFAMPNFSDVNPVPKQIVKDGSDRTWSGVLWHNFRMLS